MCKMWVGQRRAIVCQSDSKLHIVVWPINSIECHWVEGFQWCPMWFLLWCEGQMQNWFVWGNAGVQTSNKQSTHWVFLGRV